VCSGLSQATGIRRLLLRSSFILATVLHPAQAVGVYLLLTFVMRVKDDSAAHPHGSWQGESNSTTTLKGVEGLVSTRDRLRTLEQRLEVLEADLTSSESDKLRLFDRALEP
jgi:phage shock protein PspC (stress-responsive transcriptional regulator)